MCLATPLFDLVLVPLVESRDQCCREWRERHDVPPSQSQPDGTTTPHPATETDPWTESIARSSRLLKHPTGAEDTHCSFWALDFSNLSVLWRCLGEVELRFENIMGNHA